jgi:putative SOS response-associated peptidase YedK
VGGGRVDREQAHQHRGETLAEKPTFRSAFKRRRCLIPADGFYEWKAVGKKKQPYHFHMQDGSPFAFAGLWESWRQGGDEETESFTIVTTAANELLAEYHDRMPVILHPDDYDLWLAPKVTDRDRLEPLLAPYPPGQPAVDPGQPAQGDGRDAAAGPGCRTRRATA